MTAQELALVEEMVASIYQEWHLCALRKRDGRLPAGTMCDGCLSMIESRMAGLRAAIVEQPLQTGGEK